MDYIIPNRSKTDACDSEAANEARIKAEAAIQQQLNAHPSEFRNQAHQEKMEEKKDPGFFSSMKNFLFTASTSRTDNCNSPEAERARVATQHAMHQKTTQEEPHPPTPHM